MEDTKYADREKGGLFSLSISSLSVRVFIFNIIKSISEIQKEIIDSQGHGARKREEDFARWTSDREKEA